MPAVLPPPFDADLKVLVLAGSNPVSARRRRLQERRRQRGEREIPLQNKAFARLHGRLVIEYVLDWLGDAGLHNVWVLADPEQLARIPPRYTFTPIAQRPRATIFVNLSAAYAELKPGSDEPVLIVFGDHPLNTQAALGEFLARCAERLGQADFFHGFARQEQYREFATWFRRTSVHLREMSGRATGLNLTFPSRLHRLRVLDQLYAVRKQEKLGSLFELLRRLVGWLGWRSLPALADCVTMWLAKEMEKLGRRSGLARALGDVGCRVLSMIVPARRMEGYAARILQAERGVMLVPLAHGGTAIDVDFAEELQTIEGSWEDIQAVNRRQDEALGR